MLKNAFLGLALLSGLVIAQSASAQTCPNSSFKNQHMEYSTDVNSKRGFAVSCCPTGYRAHGVACADIPPDHDDADGCAVVCRSISAGDQLQPSWDFQRQPAVSQCNKTEVMVGIACVDTDKHGGGVNSDVSDGCTAVCANPKTGATRTVVNPDMGGSNRAFNVVQIPFGNRRVVGIACQDLGKGSSDRLDGCSIITGDLK